jgi:hypothetical protein
MLWQNRATVASYPLRSVQQPFSSNRANLHAPMYTFAVIEGTSGGRHVTTVLLCYVRCEVDAWREVACAKNHLSMALDSKGPLSAVFGKQSLILEPDNRECRINWKRWSVPSALILYRGSVPWLSLELRLRWNCDYAQVQLFLELDEGHRHCLLLKYVGVGHKPIHNHPGD